MTADEQGRITVTSLDVAEKFGKAHKHVLSAVESLEIPDDFRRANFSAFLIETPMPRGRGVRTYPAYAMTRDGFSLLVMGFTGKKAMEWKVRYIQAFNAMEAELKRREEVRLKAQAEQALVFQGNLRPLKIELTWIQDCILSCVPDHPEYFRAKI